MESHASPTKELRAKFPADLCEVDAFCAKVRVWLVDNYLQTHVFAVELLLREALNNAVLHGCGNDPGKKVTAGVSVSERWIRLEVADEGSGFDWRKLDAVVPGGETASGRGHIIFGQYADDYHFNHVGNQVFIRRKT